MEKKTFNCGGLFSGIGGFCYGFEKNNFVTSWVNEISKPVVDVYKENFLISSFLIGPVIPDMASY